MEVDALRKNGNANAVGDSDSHMRGGGHEGLGPYTLLCMLIGSPIGWPKICAEFFPQLLLVENVWIIAVLHFFAPTFFRQKMSERKNAGLQNFERKFSYTNFFLMQGSRIYSWNLKILNIVALVG